MKDKKMTSQPKTIADYIRLFAGELEERILENFPPLHNPSDPVWPEMRSLRRKPFPAQELAIMGIVKRWERARTAAAIAECGTGKTLISLAAVQAHSRGKPFTALAMAPPQLVKKWARECFLTLPRVRVFLIDGVRNGVGSNGHSGVNEVRLRNGRVVREGLRTTLSDLRLRKTAPSARARWDALCGCPTVFLIGRDRAKLGYFWRHAYRTPLSGNYTGCVVNADTGLPVLAGEDQLRLGDFKKAKHSEVVCPEDSARPTKARRTFHSPLWQADERKIRRYAPIDFIGRYLRDGFFDYAIADEVHELTLLGGYADELFNILFRLEPHKMLAHGFEYGSAGVRAFSETYGVLEKVTVIQPQDNACSEARVTKRVRRRPGASPLLFGHFLMDLGAFVSLEDISDALPPYDEQVVSVEMDPPLTAAYQELEEDIKAALKEHRGNQSVVSIGLNALLLYPDRPFGLGELFGYEYDPETQRRERFLISRPQDLDEGVTYAKERSLVEAVKAELARGRRCQIYAVYTKKRDVTQRLQTILTSEGIRVALLTTDVAPEAREAWYERQVRQGVQAVICHPRLVQTGLDLIDFPSLIFYESGYSTYVLRQASRRSWRIGQRQPVKVLFLHYANTMQESCLRLMGKKLLVSLAMEGKFSNEGLQCIDEDDDMLTAMARELVTEKGVGEKADSVWKALQEQHARVTGSGARSQTVTSPEPEVSEQLSEALGVPPVTQPTSVPQNGLLLFSVSGGRRKKGRQRSEEDDSKQLSFPF